MVVLITQATVVDLQRDVLDRMAFVPTVADDLKTMSPALFRPIRPAPLPDDLGQHGAGC